MDIKHFTVTDLEKAPLKLSRKRVAPAAGSGTGTKPKTVKGVVEREPVQRILKKKAKVDFTDVANKQDRKSAKRALKKVSRAVKSSQVETDPTDKVRGRWGGDSKLDALTIPTIGEWEASIKSRKLKPFIVDQLMSGQAGEYLMLSGRTGVGKTNVALRLAYCISTGKPFFGHACKQLDVAYLVFEGALKNYQDRISKIKKLFLLTWKIVFGST